MDCSITDESVGNAFNSARNAVKLSLGHQIGRVELVEGKLASEYL